MSHDIYQILENLDAAQRRAKQLPALFKAPQTSPQLAGPYPGQNATRGYLVGEGDAAPQVNRAGYNKLRDRDDYLDKRDLLYRLITQAGTDTETKAAAKERLAALNQAAKQQGIIKEGEDRNPMAQAVTRRIAHAHPEWLTRYGVESVLQAIDDVTEDDMDWEEIGSSDVSAYVNYVKDRLDDRMGSREEMDDRKPFAESAATTEDVISNMKKKLDDYLQDVATAIKTDPDLKDKLSQDIDQIAAVKTLTTDDGKEIKIRGNEDDGFRISIRNKDLPTAFKSLDEAVMACEMYKTRRRHALETADYIEEKRT